MLTDGLSFLQVLTRSHITTGKTLMIDLESVKKDYHSKDIHDIAFKRSELSVADA